MLSLKDQKNPEQRYEKIILLTSSYHMKRAVKAFRKNGMDVIPYPANIRNQGHKQYTFTDYLPNASAMKDTAGSLKEFLGMLFYTITT